jgi:hypothetical protein
MKIWLLIIVLALMIKPEQNEVDLNSIAEQYVRLVLSIGEHDPNYVDAYYGPAKWQEDARKQKLTLAQIREQAESLQWQLESFHPDQEEMEQLRYEYLKKQLQSLRSFVDLKLGKKFSFDEESRALYDAVAPQFTEEHFSKIINQLDKELPGKGPVSDKYDSFRKEFIIPKEKLDRVFQLALNESRKRTLLHIALPAEENFTVEFVTNKPWSGYNWYKGNFHSVIQVNTDLPVYVDQAVDLAGHEGYPGHHVYNVLLERELLRKRKWMEFSVYPLFSPQSLIAEGSANYGVRILFTAKERIEFERNVIFPAANVNPLRAEQYYKITELIDQLSYAGNEAARHFLDGDWNETQAVDWMMKFSFYNKERALQRLQFIKKYRSYVINYNLGRDLVAKYIENRGPTSEERWNELAKLLGSPRLPSALE